MLQKLIFFSSLGYEKIVDLLVKNGADINHENDMGKTALHRATENGIHCETNLEI